MTIQSELVKNMMHTVNDVAVDRDVILRELHQELVGPDNTTDVDRINEVLTFERPLQRYKVGVLYPKPSDQDDASTIEKDAEEVVLVANSAEQETLTKSAEEQVSAIQARVSYREEDLEFDETDYNVPDLKLSGINRPACVGISFFVRPPSDDNIIMSVFITGGVYRKQKDEDIWLRTPTTLEGRISLSEVLNKPGLITIPIIQRAADGLDISLQCVSRHFRNGYIFTVTAINCTKTSQGIKNDERCLFQSELRVKFSHESGLQQEIIAPYPNAERLETNAEELSAELIYKNMCTFGVGHGCAADWPTPNTSGVSEIWSTSLPTFEVAGITPDLKIDGEVFSVSMRDLASIELEQQGFDAIDRLLSEYSVWIENRESEINNIASHLKATAENHLNDCKRALARMFAGKNFLIENKDARYAFRLANEAILIQQKRGAEGLRSIDLSEGFLKFSKKYSTTNEILLSDDKNKGKWRPFQIAFLLLSLKSSALGEDTDREVVDLIWFPTGGGKTEAYFGLAAFSCFYRRLNGDHDDAVHVIMRYTLRLLTADQFERTAGLICAMEYLRNRDKEALGECKFSIGIWLGGTTTPNRNKDAVADYRAMLRGKSSNRFLVSKCPFCGAEIGVIHGKNRRDIKVMGLKELDDRIQIYCSDPSCDFHDALPIYVVDEDIYRFRPTLIIGTVDKFAQIAWKEECRYLFGLGQDGKRDRSPPGLIIQDELHLISGPLGSMVGLYEALIEELCTDRRVSTNVRPKIVCSTATIKRYRAQIRALYARDDACLFPPPGLNANDSFFAKWQDKTEGRGRLYAGIYGPGESIQTMQVRTIGAALQAPFSLPDSQRDPWWTLLLFFNSLRELGTTITLFQSDILTRLSILRKRNNLDNTNRRWINHVKELTSRLNTTEIDTIRNDLKVSYAPQNTARKAVDVCLASNIIEVGVDISRLGLLTIIGQPKTTAQYIQVSGRVGRSSPGLIFTIYSSSKPRDRSHFERFKSYHQRLYAQVEPTSVTPYSLPALQRAFHAVLVGYIRQTLPASTTTIWPIPPGIETMYLLLLSRIEKIFDDPKDLQRARTDLEETYSSFLEKWKSSGTSRWESKTANGDIGLLYRAGRHIGDLSAWSFKTPQSMRNVDAECQGYIARPNINTDNNQV